MILNDILSAMCWMKTIYPISVGETITLEVIKVVTERRSGVVRFDCRLIKTKNKEV